MPVGELPSILRPTPSRLLVDGDRDIAVFVNVPIILKRSTNCTRNTVGTHGLVKTFPIVLFSCPPWS